MNFWKDLKAWLHNIINFLKPFKVFSCLKWSLLSLSNGHIFSRTEKLLRIGRLKLAEIIKKKVSYARNRFAEDNKLRWIDMPFHRRALWQRNERQKEKKELFKSLCKTWLVNSTVIHDSYYVYPQSGLVYLPIIAVFCEVVFLLFI